MNYHNGQRGFGSIAFLIITFIILLSFSAWFWLTAMPQHRYQVMDEKVSVATSTDETAGWKTYRNDKYGFEFKYPSLWGDVIFKEGKTVNCQEEYALGGAFENNDATLTFSSIALENTESSIEYQILIDDLGNNGNTDNDHCDNTKSELASLMSDNKFTGGRVFKNDSGVSVHYYPSLVSVLGTDIDQQYTLYAGGETAAQVKFKFVPSYGSTELGEIENAYNNDIARFIKESDKAAAIRQYLGDLGKVVSTFKFTDSSAYSGNTAYGTLMDGDIDNGTYKIWSGTETITLNNGAYTDLTNHIHSELTTFRLGDIDGDGIREALVVLTTSRADSIEELFVVRKIDGKVIGNPLNVLLLDGNSMRGISQITIDDQGTIALTIDAMKPGDPHCCPSVHGVYNYKFSNGALHLVD